jgi:hypothetical protein
MSAGNTGNNNIIQTVANGVSGVTSASQFPSHIHFRKMWVHGDYGTLNGANKVSAGIQLTCSYCSVVDSEFSEMLRPGAEGHVILAQGPGPHKFDHNWMEGQSSSIFCGGFSATPLIAGFVPCQDVEMRRNRFTFPYAWLGMMTIPTGDVWAGQSLVRKNCMEWKEGERILRDGNLCENVDNSGGQNGTVSVINIRQTSGTGANGTNYQATINDVTFTNEIDRNACEGIEVAGRSASSPANGGGVSYPLKRMLIGNVLEYNITSTNPGCGANKFGLQLSTAGQTWAGTIVENSAGTQATFTITCSVDGGDCPAGPPSVGFQQTDISPGDPVFVIGCTGNTAFNMPTHTAGGGTVAVGVGPLASSSTNPASLVVSYPWTAPANASDTVGNCTITNLQGSPQGLIINHHTLITDANQAIEPSNTAQNGGPNFQMNHVFTNSIITSSGATGAGWYNSDVGEGNPTEIFNYDYTSLTAGYNIWPTRTASKYNDYGNAPGNALPGSVCTGSGCNPPTTSFFPATSYCTGATSTAACVGFIGAMSTSSMPLTLPDYHNFGLRSDSYFYAGAAGDASDGASQGVNIPAIDAAETQNTYSCATSCGAGPYPDR